MSKKFTGKVVSDQMQKTVVVLIESKSRHPKYHKVLTKRKRIYAHDEKDAKFGDTVEVVETRPLSKLKRFKVTKIL